MDSWSSVLLYTESFTPCSEGSHSVLLYERDLQENLSLNYIIEDTCMVASAEN